MALCNGLRLLFFLLLTTTLLRTGDVAAGNEKVLTGLDVLLSEKSEMLAHKRVAVVANHTSVTCEGEWILDGLSRIEGLRIAFLLIPEHGLDLLADETRERWKGVKTVDLHAQQRRPDEEMLAGIDAVVYDVQDLGCRFYTYISTMLLVMDASAVAGTPFIVLDRPDPLGGEIVEGPALDPDFRSFVGMYPIPIRYGLTAGELALMANGEHYLLSGTKAKLTIIGMKHWERSMYYDQTGLPWILPSPNIPDMESALLYPGMCLLEGTNLSEGRGTPLPFTLAGAPWLDAAKIEKTIEETGLGGFSLVDTLYTPVSIPGRCANPKYMSERIKGLKIRVTSRNEFRPCSFGLLLIAAAAATSCGAFEWTPGYYIDLLAGTDTLRKAVSAGEDLAPLLKQWEREAEAFKESRRPYLLYED